MIVQEDVPYTKEEVKAMVKTIHDLREQLKRLGWRHGSERPLPATGKKIIVYYKDSDGVHHAHASFLNNLYEWFGVPESVGDNLMWCYPPEKED